MTIFLPIWPRGKYATDSKLQTPQKKVKKMNGELVIDI